MREALMDYKSGPVSNFNLQCLNYVLTCDMYHQCKLYIETDLEEQISFI